MKLHVEDAMRIGTAAEQAGLRAMKKACPIIEALEGSSGAAR